MKIKTLVTIFIFIYFFVSSCQKLAIATGHYCFIKQYNKLMTTSIRHEKNRNTLFTSFWFKICLILLLLVWMDLCHYTSPTQRQKRSGLCCWILFTWLILSHEIYGSSVYKQSPHIPRCSHRDGPQGGSGTNRLLRWKMLSGRPTFCFHWQGGTKSRLLHSWLSSPTSCHCPVILNENALRHLTESINYHLCCSIKLFKF